VDVSFIIFGSELPIFRPLGLVKLHQRQVGVYRQGSVKSLPSNFRTGLLIFPHTRMNDGLIAFYPMHFGAGVMEISKVQVHFWVPIWRSDWVLSLGSRCHSTFRPLRVLQSCSNFGFKLHVQLPSWRAIIRDIWSRIGDFDLFQEFTLFLPLESILAFACNFKSHLSMHTHTRSLTCLCY
jgi:hypothetical protein